MKLISTLCLCLLCCVHPAVRAQTLAQDSLALVDFYDSTDGPHWTTSTGWKTSTPLKNWYGVTVIGSNVARLEFNENNISGQLPASLGKLKKLDKLSIVNNHLTGRIPPELGNIMGLADLNFFDNQLTGPIPSSLGNLIYLSNFDLSSNQLTGELPESLGNIFTVKYFSLVMNQLTGPVPDSYGNLINATVFALSGNKLSGHIPASLGNLKKLTGFFMDANNFDGEVPDSLLRFPKINFFGISYNHLTFAGMEGVATSYANIEDLVYDMQANISITRKDNILSVSAGGTLSNDTFRLYKDGALIETKVGDSAFTIVTNGKYNIVVTNKIATRLTLFSDTITIAALPLTITDFTAVAEKNTAVLKWTTLNEINTAYFIVERSTDGVEYKKIGEVKALKNMNVINNYSYVDNISNVSSDAIYYRLKEVDKNGAVMYSKTVLLNSTLQGLSLSISPNPVRNVISISIKENVFNAMVSITDVTGKLVYTAKQNLIAGNAHKINISGLANGIYYIVIRTKGGFKSYKIVKQ